MYKRNIFRKFQQPFQISGVGLDTAPQGKAMHIAQQVQIQIRGFLRIRKTCALYGLQFDVQANSRGFCVLHTAKGGLEMIRVKKGVQSNDKKGLRMTFNRVLTQRTIAAA
jgi:hypothetical protein